MLQVTKFRKVFSTTSCFKSSRYGFRNFCNKTQDVIKLDKYNTKEIEEHMKSLEHSSRGLVYVPKELPFIVRLDGHKFSTFTKGFDKPFDLRSNTDFIRDLTF